MYTMVCAVYSEVMGHQHELWKYIVDFVQVVKDPSQVS